MLKYALLFTMLLGGSQAHAQSLFVKRQSDRASEEVLKQLFPEAPVVGLRTLLVTVDGEKRLMTYGYPASRDSEGSEAELGTRSLKLTLQQPNDSGASKIFDPEIWDEIQSRRRANDRVKKLNQLGKQATEFRREDWNRTPKHRLPTYGELKLLLRNVRESLQASLSVH